MVTLTVLIFSFEYKVVFKAPVISILKCNVCKNETENREAHPTTSDEMMKKLLMEMKEKMRKQTTKTAKKIMMTLLWNVIFY